MGYIDKQSSKVKEDKKPDEEAIKLALKSTGLYERMSEETVSKQVKIVLKLYESGDEGAAAKALLECSGMNKVTCYRLLCGLGAKGYLYTHGSRKERRYVLTEKGANLLI